MRDLDLQTLRLFAAVCDQRSIARVAEQESIVGSAISKRLAQLEDTVGTPLLLRKRRGVVPTPAGETLLEHARTMLASVGQIERDMAAYATGTRGHVRMLVTASVMAESLADDVAAFLQDPAHRDIQISMEERVSPDVVQGIREGSASIGICWDAADLSGLQSRAWRSDQLAVVMAPDHPLAQREQLALLDSLSYEQVCLPPGTAVQMTLQRAAARHGQTIKSRVVAATFDAALRVVRARLAIAVLPAELCAPYANSFGLRVVPLTDAWAKRRFAICFRSEDALTPAARALTEHLVRLASHGKPNASAQ